MQQQDNHEYPFLYQRQTCHQVQPNQATYQKRQKCQPATYLQEVLYRSEERRVGKECRTRRSAYHDNKICRTHKRTEHAAIDVDPAKTTVEKLSLEHATRE